MTFTMADKYPEWFNTPALQYISMKREFLGEIQNENDWGEFGTEEQVVALSKLLAYFKSTKQLADQFPQLVNDVIVENKNLVMHKILPIPSKLYEQLLLAVVEGTEEEYINIWQQPSFVTLGKIQNFFEKRRTNCLASYQSKMRSESLPYKISPLEKAGIDIST